MELRELGGRLIVLNILRRSQMHDCLESAGLHRGQLPLLEDVIAHPGTAQQAAADRLLITPASVAQSVKRLCKNGLLEKRPDPGNARKNALYATEAGRRTAADCRVHFDETDARTFAGISEEELAALAGLLDKMIQNLSDGGKCLPSFPCWKEKQA